MIEVDRLSKTFRSFKKAPGLWGSVRSLFHREWTEKSAISEISLSVAQGEIVGVLGANGAGKTTLVKALAGIIHPSAGSAHVLGHIPWRRPRAFQRKIALIMGQKAQLWWDLPAADCFELLQEIYQIPEAQFRETLGELVAALGVSEQLHTQIRRLSLGERMKMELIAALLHRPEVIYLDEPTIGLDLTAQRAIREFILNYRKRHSCAMLITSHYMEDIEALCERIVILREGKLVYDGPLAQIRGAHSAQKTIRAQIEGEPEIVVTVPREQVAERAAEILRTKAVRDLAIEEEDLGTLIEAIQRGVRA